MKHSGVYKGQLRRCLKGSSSISARRPELEAARTNCGLGTIDQTVLFVATRIDLHLGTDPDTLLALSCIISLGHRVVNAIYELKAREEAAKISQGISAEQRRQRLLERARQARDNSSQEHVGVAAFKQQQQAITAAAEKA